MASLKGTAALKLLAATCAAGQDLQFYRDEVGGVRYLKTAKGNPVAVTLDERGNIIMVDPAGNLYYDTGSPQLGIYMVGRWSARAHILYQDNNEFAFGRSPQLLHSAEHIFLQCVHKSVACLLAVQGVTMKQQA